ncbi:MAG: hypothetical protein JWP44_4491 [Mucilaginibacter sp.]|nr:hypothetical protein [Mucilaginibacter sp.]
MAAIDPSYIIAFHDHWIEQLLHYPRIAVPWTTEGCVEATDCQAYILPGSLEQVMLAESNVSLLEGLASDPPKAIRINHGQAIVLTFTPIPGNDSFRLETDCTTYWRDTGRDGFQVCRKQEGSSILVGMNNPISTSRCLNLLDTYASNVWTNAIPGWRPCPLSVFMQGQCANETRTWENPSDLRIKVQMSAFLHVVTTIYDVDSRMITNVQSPYLVGPLFVNITEYDAIWDTISNTPFSSDQIAWDSFLYRLCELYRGYGEEPYLWAGDDSKLREHLQNFLAVKMNFGTLLTVFLDNALTELGLNHTRFSNLMGQTLTTATWGRSIQVFVAQRWTVTVFGGASIAVVLVCGGYIHWVLMQDEPTPKCTGIPEIDLIAITTGDSGKRETDGQPTSLGGFVKGLNPEQKSSIRRLVGPLMTARIVFTAKGHGGALSTSADQVLTVFQEHRSSLASERDVEMEVESGTEASTPSAEARAGYTIQQDRRKRSRSLP